MSVASSSLKAVSFADRTWSYCDDKNDGQKTGRNRKKSFKVVMGEDRGLLPQRYIVTFVDLGTNFIVSDYYGSS
jgi:hypothetical protein